MLKEGLLEIGAYAFENCKNLKEIVLPKSLVRIDVDAFAGCDDLVIKTSVSEDEIPEDFAEGWQGSAAEVIWLEKEETSEELQVGE